VECQPVSERLKKLDDLSPQGLPSNACRRATMLSLKERMILSVISDWGRRRHGTARPCLRVPKSGPEALNWYMKAGKKGNVAAELKAGYIFREGLEDVPQDYEQALKWFRKAAQQGSGEAEYNLGRMYQDGLGVVQSVDQAADWYTKAVHDGFPSAGVALRNLQR